MIPIQKTPLCEAHVKLGARMVDFSGWYMPVQYDGILAEHQRTRSDVTMFDTCHMGRFWVTGSGSREALDRIFTTDILGMKDGQCRYGFLLNGEGGILDDTITYRFSDTRWLVVVNAGTLAGDREWIHQHLPAGVGFEDASVSMAKIDVQGPNAFVAVKRVLAVDAAALAYFRFRTFDFGGEAIVSRTGYTGEKGVELYVATERINDLWQRFLEAGVKPAGLGARDTLRLEAGLPLYGHELSTATTPVEAAMDRYSSKSRPFIGSDALVSRRAQGAKQLLVGFKIAGRQSARAGQTVLAQGVPSGTVSSGSFSPTLGYVIGFAYVTSALAVPGTRVQVDTGRTVLEAEITTIPFYKAV